MTEGRRPVIVVLGGINMDLVGATDQMPTPGETVFGRSFHTAPGGKGANQAVAAARLGAEVRMVGRVGDDEFGPALIEGLRDEGVDVSGVYVDPDNSSGIAMILLDAEKQNYIIAVYGANLACDARQVQAVESALEGAECLLLQLETPLEVAVAAARLAKGRGATVVWDPAPALDMGAEAFSLCDVLTPNQVEAERLTGIEVSGRASAEEAAHKLVASGVAAAVVKLGENGAVYSTGQETGFIPAFSVETRDTVAAGDAFAAGLAVALTEGRTLTDALSFGSTAGALAVTRSGAQEAMPFRSEVDSLYAAGPASRV